MIKKAFLSIVGFGLGAFMILNGVVSLYRAMKDTIWNLTPFEKFFSAGVTGVVGIVLISWTYLLVKKRKKS